jgi:peptidoglycan hydrolase-like protein with peptidoglycan-binding domain
MLNLAVLREGRINRLVDADTLGSTHSLACRSVRGRIVARTNRRPAGIVQRLLLFVFLLLAALSSQAQAQRERRVALVVGNAVSADRKVQPSRDAALVALRLKRQGFDVVEATDADRAALGSALERFSREAAAADTALFYFSGRLMHRDSQNWLIPADAVIEGDWSIDFQAVPLDIAMNALARTSGQGARILMLDAYGSREDGTAGSGAFGGGFGRLPHRPGFLAGSVNNGVDPDGRGGALADAFLSIGDARGLDAPMLFALMRQEIEKASAGRLRLEASALLAKPFSFRPDEAYARFREELSRRQTERQRSFQAARRDSDDGRRQREEEQRRVLAMRAEEQRRRLDEERQKAEAERLAREKAEQDRLAKQKDEDDRRQAEARRLEGLRAAEALKLEQQRLAREQAEQERLAKQQEEARRQEALRTAEAQKLEQQRLAREQAEQERLAKQQEEARRQEALRTAEAQKLEQQRLAREQAEQERLAKQQEEARRQEALRTAEAQKLEQQRLAREQAERESAARDFDAPTPLAALPQNLPPAVVSPSDRPTVIRYIQGELRRLGCFDARDSGAYDNATREAVRDYREYSGLKREAAVPNDDVFLRELRERKDRVCPLECEDNEVLQDGRCIAIARPPRATPARVAPSRPPERPAVRQAAPAPVERARPAPQREAAPRPAPAPRAAAPAPAAPPRAPNLQGMSF